MPKAIEITDTKSKIVMEDKGWYSNTMLFDTILIKKEFSLDFVASPEIARHLEYLSQK